MSSLRRVFASLLFSIALGSSLFYFEIDAVAYIIDIAPITFLPRSWQETLYHIIFSLIFGAPIGALAQRHSAPFGALTIIVGDLLTVYYWLQIPPPRSEFGMNYFVTSVFLASIWALSSHLWWTHAFKHRIARTE